MKKFCEDLIAMADTNWINWLLFAAHLVLAILSAGHALLYKRDSRAALGWIAICITFPLAGPFLYFIFGINRIPTRAREMDGRRRFRLPAGYERQKHERQAVSAGFDLPAEYAELSRISDAVTRRPLVGGNSVEPLYNGEKAYPAMLAAIDSAGQRVYLSTYIFVADTTGRLFVESLRRAIGRGVDVRVLIDGVGEWYSLPRIGPKLRKAGVRFTRFLPPTLFPPTLHINLRNHRKLLVIDGRIGFAGGMNIGDRHLVEKEHNPRRTVDIHFQLRGPVVGQMEEAFLEDWDFASREQSVPPGRPAMAAEAGDAICRAFLDGPNEDLDKLSMILISSISSAHKKVTIVTPYFLPSREFIGALQAAALRGIDVVLVLPEKSNQPLVHWATRNMLWELLQWGVRVLYQPPPFAHTKLFIVDDHYVQIGSANLDPRSLRLNFELMVEVYDKALAETLADYIGAILKDSREVTLEEMDGRSLHVRLRDAACWLFSPYL